MKLKDQQQTVSLPSTCIVPIKKGYGGNFNDTMNKHFWSPERTTHVA